MSDASEVSGRTLVRNTVANAVGAGVVAVLAVLLTPFFLRRLGPSEYGVWLLATTLTFANGYLGLADLGLQQAGVRLVADARGRRDIDAVNEVISTMAVLFVVLGAVLGLTLASLASTIAGVFEIEESLRSAAATVFLLVGVQVALDLPSASFLAVIEGAQRYAALRVVDVGSRLAWGIVVVVVVRMGGGVVAMAIVSLAVAVVALAVSFVLARHIEPGLRVSPRRATRRMLRNVLGQGSSLLLLRVTSVVYRQMDRAVIGIALAASTVARYEVAYKIHATAAMVLSVAPSAVMPAAAYLNAADDRDQLRRMYLRGTKYALALSVPVTMAALLYARPLIATWVGAEYVDLTGATRLFLVYPILVSVHVVGLTMLVGLGRMREMVVLSPAAVALNLVVSMLLVRRLGIVGVIWGTLAGYVVVWVPYLRLMLRSFSVGLGEWLSAVVLPNLPGAAAQLAFGVATIRLSEGFTQLWQVGLIAVASCAVNTGCFLFLVLRAQERAGLLGAFRRPRSSEGPVEHVLFADEAAGTPRHELPAGPLDHPR